VLVVTIGYKKEGGSAPSIVKIPGLDPKTIQQIFEAHAQHVEGQEELSPSRRSPSSFAQFFGAAPGDQMIGLPLRFGPGGFEGIGHMLQHDPNQADAPDLPPEILQKIANISQVLGIDNVATLPQSEAGCNCFHCQIANAINHTPLEQQEMEEPAVSDEELKFRTWDISQIGDKLYCVSDPENSNRKYNVFLGKPIGCTCGDSSCEHIKAVLRS
jgi:hypothetical protein